MTITNAEILDEVDVERLASECGLNAGDVRKLIDWIEGSSPANLEYLTNLFSDEVRHEMGGNAVSAITDTLEMVMADFPFEALELRALLRFLREYHWEKTNALFHIAERRSSALSAVGGATG